MPAAVASSTAAVINTSGTRMRRCEYPDATLRSGACRRNSPYSSNDVTATNSTPFSVPANSAAAGSPDQLCTSLSVTRIQIPPNAA